jgi:hypothetical protein
MAESIQYIKNSFQVNNDIKHIIEFIQVLTKFGIKVNSPKSKTHGVRFISLFSMPHIPQCECIEDEPCEYWNQIEYDLMLKHSDFIQSQFDRFGIGHMFDDSLDVVMESPDDDE